ncbi:MAG: hypothetical protein ABSH00_13450 [Bryobacteraceae bacterium]|jgi:hypothetical protein
MADEAKRYHVRNEAAPWFLDNSSVGDLEKWATDPNCIEMEACAKALAERLGKLEKLKAARETAKAAEVQRLSERRQMLQDNPFDPRTEVSADAKHIASLMRTEVSADARHIASRIVKHLWIIFVLLPFVVALLLVIAGIIK